MQLESTRFGTLSIAEDTILTFPEGLAGFEIDTKWKLLHEEFTEEGNGSGARQLKEERNFVHYLQSVDDPDITLPVMDPTMFGFDYDMTLTAEDIGKLDVRPGDYVAVLLVISKYPSDLYREDRPIWENIKANISGPILLNTRSRIGLQKVLPKLIYDITMRVREEPVQRQTLQKLAAGQAMHA